MAEQLYVSAPPLIDELNDRLRMGFDKAPLAQTNDFRNLQMDFNDVIDRFPAEGDYQGFPNVSSSVYLRQAGQPEDAPRFRLITDPSGNLNHVNRHRGDPVIALRLEQGQKDGRNPDKGKIGSWLTEVTLVLGKSGGVGVMALGTSKSGRRNRHVLPGSSPKTRVAKKELLDWIKDQIGDPDTLVPAHTPAEVKGSGFLGGLALGHRA